MQAKARDQQLKDRWDQLLTHLTDQFSFLFQYFDTTILEESILYKPIKNLGEIIFEWLLDRKELLPQELV